MPIHDRFEELCALASAGEIAEADAEVLEAHLDECFSCRHVLADLREIHAQWLPSDHRSDDVTRVQHWRLRQAILKRASREGAQFSKEALTAAQERAFVPANWRYGAITALAGVTITVGFLIANHGRQHAVVINSMSATQNAQMAQLATDRDSLTRRLTQVSDSRSEIESQLETARAAVARLEKRLQETEMILRGSEQSRNATEREMSELRSELEAARNLQATAVAELNRVKATDEAISLAQQQEIRELNSKLESKSASLDREREMLSAGREIRDLIAARNLHIIDVYDTNGNGKTSRAFGRVFYTEGKSLVFYGYDLNPRQANMAKFGFYVWGKRDGAPQDVKSLGRMSKDDREQKRWVLTITDPKMLAELDSVFVTLEPSDTSVKPSGKPLLSAFLGTPANHP